MNRAMIAVASLVLTAGCGGHSKSNKGTATGATSGGVTPAASVQGAPSAGAVNVLQGTSASSTASAGATGATGAAGAAAAATPSPASGGSPQPMGSSAPASGTATAASPSGGAAFAATPSAGAQLHGTIPPDPSTGFDGTLYVAGERLAPGSVVHVAVNGVPTKVLPAAFHSSELLGVYVYLTVPADYTFTAVAPDGSMSSPVTFTVSNGGLARLTGLTPPEVHMVFPPALDTSFMGTVWVIGDQFMPGCVLTVQTPGLLPYVAPLVWLNERTAGWVTATPLAGNVTLQVTNPTLMTSQTFTVTVGQATAATGGPTPVVYAPAAVSSPFVGTVHLVGSGLLPGAMVELRAVGGATASSTPLISISSVEAWWTLVYPQAGNYELRVVNPGGSSSPWLPFDVQ